MRVTGRLLAAIVTATHLLRAADAARADGPVEAAALTRDTSVSPMRERLENFTRDQAVLDRFYRTELSPARQKRRARFLDETAQALDQVDFERLDQEGRIDFLLLRNRLRDDRRALAERNAQLAEVAPLLPFAPVVVGLLDAQDRFAPLDPVQAASAVNDLAAQARKVHDQLVDALDHTNNPAAAGATNAAPPLPDRVHARRALQALENLRAALRDWHDFHSGYHPQFGWWVEEAWLRASRELDAYSTLLRKRLMGVTDEDNEPLIGDPIGRARLLESLETEMVAYSPEELIEIANREFAWCEAEMKKAASELGVPDWKHALALVSERRAPPGDQPRVIHDLAEEAVRFVTERRLVTVPDLARDGWRMEMMSPARQKVNPYFTGGEVISISYPTDTMSYEDKLMSMRGNNLHFSRATVHHELIPGHHLQGYMAARYRTHREAFGTPFLVEGWALYWEMLLWDLNFARSAEDRVGMLFWRSHRCARILFSLKYHLSQMTADEAVNFLVDRVGHERRNATAEVRRSINGDYSPLYQAAYMVGGLQLRALRHELVDARKMTDLEFHDAVLRENAIPIDLIRASLTHRPLTRDERPHWRFYPL